MQSDREATANESKARKEKNSLMQIFLGHPVGAAHLSDQCFRDTRNI